MAIFRPTYTDKKTGELKESGVWWFEFVYAGKRWRESTKTSRKTLAVDFEKRRLELERHYTKGIRPVDPGQMLRTVKELVSDYQTRYDTPSHTAKSISWVNERMPHVIRLLGPLSILDVSDERIAGYMKGRRKEGAGNRTINMELHCLARAAGRS